MAYTDIQNIEVTGKITSASVIDIVELPFEGKQSAAIVITGTWSATLVVEASCNSGVSWSTVWLSVINQSPVANGIPIPSNSITTNGTYKIFNTSGITHYRVRATSYTSGTINVLMQAVNAPSSFTYVSGSIIQSIAIDSNNSSTTNLTSANSYTFTGTATTTLGVAGIQVSLKTDQNCIVYIDQSPNGTNWDVNDSYIYYASINNFGVTVQAINSYVRVRVVLSGTVDTTYFRLQTTLCPIVEALPRSLDEKGDLKTAIRSMKDSYGFGVENTPTDEMRVVIPFRLAGGIFAGTTLDSNFWTSSLGTGGAATVGGAQVILSTGTTANNTTSIQSVRNARYIGASANRFRIVLRIPDAGVTDNVRRWGAFNSTDGCFFELAGSTLKIVTRKSSSDTAVSSGFFNGTLGSTYTLDTTVKTMEIYWSNSKVWFVVGGELLHTVNANSTTWTSDINLPIRLENNNSNGVTTDVSLNVRTATISRLGNEKTQSVYKYQSGTTAGVILKYSAGNLHALNVSGVNNNSVITLYDGTSTGGTILYSTGTMAANAVPFSIPFYSLTFSTGLFLVISGANSNATVIYE